MADFNLPSCTVSISKKPHDEAPERFYCITGTVDHPNLGQIASLRGYLLTTRYAWKRADDFFEIMDGESDELMHFSCEVFDSNINVRSCLIDGSRRSGSGCWGRELNAGDIVYVEDITVKEEYRRRGVGSKLLRELWGSRDIVPTFSFDGSPHFYCWPACKTAESEEIAVDFFRKNGFRRVGLTNFLCYSTDPDHASRNLAIRDDPEPPTRQYPNPENMFPEQIAIMYPLHFAISSKKGQEVVDVINSAYAADPSSIHKPGPHGFTPIHEAAEALNADAIRTLLKLGVADDLKNTVNRSGNTPLETFIEALRTQRQLAEVVYKSWDGYRTDELAAEYMLKKASGVPLSPSSEKEYVAKRKFGCTCGECTDGWLSPRMRHRLSVSAIVQFDTDMMSLGYINRRASVEEYLSEIWALAHIPEALHRKLNKGLCADFISMFRTIRDILETPGAIPDANRVMKNSGAFLFTGMGGKAEHAIDAILSVAYDQSPLGDNTFDEPHGEENDAFPGCDNDLAFGLVRRKLGLDPALQWGPYA